MKCVSDLSSTWKLAPVIIIIIIIIFFANSCLRIIKWYFLIYIDFYYIRVKILLHSFIQQKVEQKGLTKVFTSLDLPSTPDLIVIPPDLGVRWCLELCISIKQTSYSLGCRQHIISWTFKQKYCPVCLLVQQIIY